MNVNAFWTGAALAEGAALARALRPGGLLCLVYDGPGSDARDIGAAVAAGAGPTGSSPSAPADPDACASRICRRPMSSGIGRGLIR